MDGSLLSLFFLQHRKELTFIQVAWEAAPAAVSFFILYDKFPSCATQRPLIPRQKKNISQEAKKEVRLQTSASLSGLGPRKSLSASPRVSFFLCVHTGAQKVDISWEPLLCPGLSCDRAQGIRNHGMICVFCFIPVVKLPIFN